MVASSMGSSGWRRSDSTSLSWPVGTSSSFTWRTGRFCQEGDNNKAPIPLTATIKIAALRSARSALLRCVGSLLPLVSFLYSPLRAIEIVAVHQDDNHGNVLVKKFLFTAKGKIQWWPESKKMIKRRCNMPKPGADGYFTINFLLLSAGYKEEGKYDRFCFADKQTEKIMLKKSHFFC